jgi:hypothetical protein
MEVIDSQQFLNWAGVLGISEDQRYSAPRCLVYADDRIGRFWEVPKSGAAIPSFVNCLLDGMNSWSHCYLWPRGGVWRCRSQFDRPCEHVYHILLQSTGIPDGFAGAVRCYVHEKDKLTAAIFGALTFGISVCDDFFIIPDHARQFLQTDHHDVVHVNFADEQTVNPFVDHMARNKYTLPDEEPDATFKRPDWMK